MKKKIIFHLSYEGVINKGNRSTLKEYSIFTRKSKILNDFFNWTISQKEEIKKETSEATIIIKSITILGL